VCFPFFKKPQKPEAYAVEPKTATHLARLQITQGKNRHSIKNPCKSVASVAKKPSETQKKQPSTPSPNNGREP